ncbi:MAG: hypothetical protein JW797_10720 [Bradymonadales bacterium]|nr:hypothetical protein [Bradymonadales bacterium]
MDDHCDYIETECWDVVDVYCDAWGCWEEWHTECVDYCVDVDEAYTSPECLEDYHCPTGYWCDRERCVPIGGGSSGSGLCEPCQTNADCEEPGALCLDLTPDATTGYCGRSCTGGSDCPAGYECLAIAGESVHQCVPERRDGVRSCEEVRPTPVECSGPNDCPDPLVCEQGRCVMPMTSPCEDEGDCQPGETCVDDVCVPQPIECTSRAQCEADEECVDGTCRTLCDTQEDCPPDQLCLGGLCSPPPPPECSTGADCEGEGPFYCINGSCRPACQTDEDCDFGYYCRGFYCDIDPAVECRTNLECGRDERCVQGECLVMCNTGCDCPTGLSCDQDGYCRDLPLPDSCQDECDCPGGYDCVESTCVPPQS